MAAPGAHVKLLCFAVYGYIVYCGCRLIEMVLCWRFHKPRVAFWITAAFSLFNLNYSILLIYYVLKFQ